MDEEAIKKYLMENLSLDAREQRGWYGEHSVYVQLKLGNEIISEAYINMPTPEKSSW